MKKLVTSFLAITLVMTIFGTHEAKAEMPAKARAFLTIVGYGTAGGALLGTASLAFGTSTRAVAQGASIGLYAGILFGGYVLYAASQKKSGQYDNSSYDESSDVYGEDYDAEDGGDNERGPQGSFLNRINVLQERFNGQAFTMDSQKERGSKLPPLSINLINMSF